MTARYVLAPKAARDFVEIWSYLEKQAGGRVADRVASSIREKIAFLAATPGAGHARPDLTEEDVRFFSVYSYLIVYWPDTRPLQVVSILHGRRDVAGLLKQRL